MSHAGPPPEPPQGDQPYNPYPDNWESSGTPPTPPPAQNPYDQTNPYAQAQRGAYGQEAPYGDAAAGSANPYAGSANPNKPTFGFGGYAGWFPRVGAFIIDYILYAVSGAPAWIGQVILLQNSTTTTDAQGVEQIRYHDTGLGTALILLGAVTAIAFFVWNICIRQGRTGATVGKSVLAIRLVNSDLQPIGGGWAFLRSMLHIVDYLPCLLGFFWPIWDSRKQTFADKIMNTFVIQATTEAPRPY